MSRLLLALAFLAVANATYQHTLTWNGLSFAPPVVPLEVSDKVTALDGTQFQSICSGTTKIHSFNLLNDGTESMTNVRLTSDTPEFTFSWTQPLAALSAGQAVEVVITYTAPSVSNQLTDGIISIDYEVNGVAENFEFAVQGGSSVSSMVILDSQGTFITSDPTFIDSYFQISTSTGVAETTAITILNNNPDCPLILDTSAISSDVDTTGQEVFKFCAGCFDPATVPIGGSVAGSIQFLSASPGRFTGTATFTAADGVVATVQISAHIESNSPTMAPTSAPTTAEPPATFDFASCSGGAESFFSSLPQADDIVFIGTIPRYIHDLNIQLSSVTDIDIQLYNTEDTSTYDIGAAIINYCTPLDSCNLGQFSQTNVTFNYPETDGSEFFYTGFLGVNGQRGFEFITVDKTSVEMDLYAYAYESGFATVTYSWSKTTSPCCLGTDLCYGDEFERNLKTAGDVFTLGEIPAGVIDVTIQLTSASDIDVQLFNETGAPLIKWCVECFTNTSHPFYGIMGSSVGIESRTYESGVTITYSGIHGGSTNSSEYGNEWITITGAPLDQALTMKVFAYDVGVAFVEYTYKWPVGTTLE